jgi:hypothetical protein
VARPRRAWMKRSEKMKNFHMFFCLFLCVTCSHFSIFFHFWRIKNENNCKIHNHKITNWQIHNSFWISGLFFQFLEFPSLVSMENLQILNCLHFYTWHVVKNCQFLSPNHHGNTSTNFPFVKFPISINFYSFL